ncbi:MAG: SseB family protein [Micromonosporaceae bacterium]
MAAEWQPATGLERALQQAVQERDQAAYLQLLEGVGLLVPVRQDAEGRTTGWVTSVTNERTFLLAYTSQEALSAVAGERQVPCLTVSLDDFARRWPDPAWWLAINSGLPTEFVLAPQQLLELAESKPAEPRRDSVGDVGSAGAQGGSAGAPPQQAGARGDDPAAAVAGSLADFHPANEVEAAMLAAVRRGDTDGYLKALLLAEVVVPRGHEGVPLSSDPDFNGHTIQVDGEQCLPLFTSEERFRQVFSESASVSLEALEVVRRWPDQWLSLAVNPGSAVGASLPGSEVLALAEWAAEIGLVELLEEAELPEDEDKHPETQTVPSYEESAQSADPTAMENTEPAPDTTDRTSEPFAEAGETLQRVLIPDHVNFYLQRGYHMVSGFVHRLRDVSRTATPAKLYAELGLDGADSRYLVSESVAHVVRWPAYGDGGYGDSRPVDNGSGAVPQRRVSGVPVPHGAEICRIDETGQAYVLATYDADGRAWCLESEEPQ